MSLSIDKIQYIELVAFMSRCKYVTSRCNNITPPTMENDPPTMENDLDPLQWKLRVDPLQGNMVTRSIKGES